MINYLRNFTSWETRTSAWFRIPIYFLKAFVKLVPMQAVHCVLIGMYKLCAYDSNVYVPFIIWIAVHCGHCKLYSMLPIDGVNTIMSNTSYQLLLKKKLLKYWQKKVHSSSSDNMDKDPCCRANLNQEKNLLKFACTGINSFFFSLCRKLSGETNLIKMRWKWIDKS